MRDLASVANQLRKVRWAKKRFLHKAVVEQAVIEPMLERIRRELAAKGMIFQPRRTDVDDKE